MYRPLILVAVFLGLFWLIPLVPGMLSLPGVPGVPGMDDTGSSVLVYTALAAEQYTGEVLKVDVDAKKLTVKKPDGNRFTFVVNEKTGFSGKRQSLRDLSKGDHVTVDFETTGGQYTATRVAVQ